MTDRREVYIVEEVTLLGTVGIIGVYEDQTPALLAANEKIHRRMTIHQVIPTEATTKIEATFMEQAPPPPSPSELAYTGEWRCLRCQASSWRGNTKQPYGPGGWNRCVLDADPSHTEHEDDWGNVFTLTSGASRILRNTRAHTDQI